MLEAIVDLRTPDDSTLGVILKRPEGEGPFPVVLLFHDGPGIREATHQVVGEVAEAGYYVVAPDRYHRFGRFVHVEPEALMAAGPDSDLMRSFFGMVMGTTDDHVRADVDAVLAHLATDPAARPGEMGCIGYCNGVRFLLRCMAEHPETFVAGAGLHPSFCVSDDADSPHLVASKIPGHLYVAIDEEDHLAPVEHNQPLINELSKLSERSTVEVLPGADHGFAVPGPNYHEDAAEHALEKTLDLFKRVLD
ncbi:dienelactone hydrolase family protein [Singulisphaera sp. PoT]|uniref:dienelactone hydrolase family protein n=1 Tax=Singulisphaera sp. PoT TaxID=3411797 RepID=UPI003BF619BE